MEVSLPEQNRHSKLSAYCKKIFNDKSISKEDFLKELAYTAIKYGFNDLDFKPLPQAPNTINIYNGLSPQQKKGFVANNDWYFRTGEGAIYLQKKEEIENLNNRNEKWLKEMAEILKLDPEASRKIKNKINVYVFSRDNYTN